MFELGADPNKALLYSTAFNNCRLMNYVITKHKSSVNAKFEDGQTAAHIAVVKNYFDALNLLKESGASIKATNAQGMTPLDIIV